MKLRQVIVTVNVGGRIEKVIIDFVKVAGSIEYIQSGAPTEVLGFTQPIAQHIAEMAFDGETALED